MLAVRNLTRSARRGFVSAEKMMNGMFSNSLDTKTTSQQRGVTSDVYDVGAATNIKFHDGMVPRETKEKILDQKGVVIWFTGK